MCCKCGWNFCDYKLCIILLINDKLIKKNVKNKNENCCYIIKRNINVIVLLYILVKVIIIIIIEINVIKRDGLDCLIKNINFVFFLY